MSNNYITSKPLDAIFQVLWCRYQCAIKTRDYDMADKGVFRDLGFRIEDTKELFEDGWIIY